MYANQTSTLLDRREMLRVKLKSLAAEARFIRKEELRTRGALRAELWQHRTHAVRSEARATHVAYGLLRGLQLVQIEPHSDTPPNWRKVRAMLRKYGTTAMRKLPDTNEPISFEAKIEAAALPKAA